MDDRKKHEFDDVEHASDAAEDAFSRGAGPEDVEDNRNAKKERELDHGLKETFPASDPVSISPGAD